MIVTPTEYLRANLDPISKKIDGFGGYNILVGLIAAGGEPHIYITGNVASQPTLAKEIYEALSDKLRSMASQAKPESNIILGPGAI
jgi:hypothetical protein